MLFQNSKMLAGQSFGSSSLVPILGFWNLFAKDDRGQVAVQLSGGGTQMWGLGIPQSSPIFKQSEVEIDNNSWVNKHIAIEK